MKNINRFTTFACIAILTGAIQFAWSATPAFGQAQASANSAASEATSTAAAASSNGRAAEIKNGTKISAELMSNIDTRKLKQGDKVKARVTKNVKQHGRVVVHKGDILVGNVTSVQNSLKGKDGSSMGVQFDQLVHGNSTTQLNAVLTSVFAASSSQADESDSMAMPPMQAPVAPAAGGGGGGGLLGGVGSSVGSTVGSTVGAAGSTLGQAGGAVGATTQNTLGAGSNLGLATPMREIHVGSSASAESSAGTNSMLSTRKGNLRLESGTQMQFRVAANGDARASR